MKKLFLLVFSLLIMIILFQSCRNSPQRIAQGPANPGLAVLDECLPRSLNVSFDSVIDEGSLDAYLARELSESYARDAFKGYMSNPRGRIAGANEIDTRAIWFDLGRLKNLIQTIEKSVCERNCEVPLRLGVRFYLAKYKPDTGPRASDVDLKHVPADYANRTTLFMVGTFDDEKGRHIDFDPTNVGNNKCRPISFRRLMDSLIGRPLKVSSMKTLNYAFMNLRDTAAMNQGDLMPPPDGRGIFPTDYN